MKDKKVYLGIRDGMLVIGTMSLNDANAEHYWYLNTETKREVYTEEEMQDSAKEYLQDGELWKMAVSEDRTTESLEDWVGLAVDSHGAESILDVQQIGEYFFSWDCIGGWKEHKKVKGYTVLFVNRKDFNLFFKDSEHIPVGSEREKQLLSLFKKYENQNEIEIAEEAREAYKEL